MKTLDERLSSVLTKYNLKENETPLPYSDTIGWRIIGVVDERGLYTTGIRSFITGKDGWISEFKIATIKSGGSTIIIASPDCPEIYFLDPSEIVEFVKEYIGELKTYMGGESLIPEYEKILRDGIDFNRPWLDNTSTVSWSNIKTATTSSLDSLDMANGRLYYDGSNLMTKMGSDYITISSK